MQKSIFPQKIPKSLCITTKSLYTNSKFQTQLSQKLQRFRTCRKNKKCSIFHDLSEYQQKWQLFPPLDWSFKSRLDCNSHDLYFCYRLHKISCHFVNCDT